MRLTSLLVFPTAAILLIGACKSSASPAGTTQPPPPPAVTASVQTGIAPVDAFLNLMANDDLQTITDHTAFQPIECEPDLLVQDASPYCNSFPAGVTVLDGIRVGCFPFWSILKDRFPETIQWLTDDTMVLEKVQSTDSGYALTFIKQGQPPTPAFSRSVVYLTDDGRLESYASCGEFTEPLGVVGQVWP